LIHIVVLILLIVLGVSFRAFGFAPVFASLFSGLVLFYGFYVFDRIFKIGFEKRHYMIMLIIALTGPGLIVVLVQVLFYYDKLLHFVHPILLSSIVFFIVSKLKIKRAHALFLVFFIVVACFAIFEMIEYSIDLTSDFKMQGSYSRNIVGAPVREAILSPIDDTMTDMILGLGGALAYLVYGFIKEV